MMDTRDTFQEVVRQGIERGSDGARQEFEKQAEIAREEVGKQADEARKELGYRVFDLADEYFPEASRDRRLRHVGMGAAVGLGVGFGLRHLLGR